MTAVLELDHLRVTTFDAGVPRALVQDCSLSVSPGEALGLVGESGSGKTLSLRAIAGLLPANMIAEGRLASNGIDFASQPVQTLTEFRTHQVGLVFQTPRAHLNPLRTIGDFMTEALVFVGGERRARAEKRAMELLDEVGITDPARRMMQRPGDLSGGLLQRVMIAATLAMEPSILLADEITTALDVTTQEEVMALLGDLRKNRNLAVLFVTHDLALAGSVCDRITVMKDGRTIETHASDRIRADAKDPYTKKLLNAALDIEALTGSGVATDKAPLLTVTNLRKTFKIRAGKGWRREVFTAVDGVSLQLEAGQSLGIVGESGSGKSTTARLICGLEKVEAGEIAVKGASWTRFVPVARRRRERAKVIQMVFQDPYQSLDPRQSVRSCLTEALRVHQRSSDSDVTKRIEELMGSVQLSTELLDQRPRSLSGGQRQRVAIARALAAEPEVLILDEAVSALDVTTQVDVLTLLDRIRRDTGVALLMISHDLTVVRRLCDYVVVMRHGQIVEQGAIADVLDRPQADYTKELLASVPRPGWKPRRKIHTQSALSKENQ